MKRNLSYANLVATVFILFLLSLTGCSGGSKLKFKAQETEIPNLGGEGFSPPPDFPPETGCQTQIDATLTRLRMNQPTGSDERIGTTDEIWWEVSVSNPGNYILERPGVNAQPFSGNIIYKVMYSAPGSQVEQVGIRNVNCPQGPPFVLSSAPFTVINNAGPGCEAVVDQLLVEVNPIRAIDNSIVFENPARFQINVTPKNRSSQIVIAGFQILSPGVPPLEIPVPSFPSPVHNLTAEVGSIGTHALSVIVEDPALPGELSSCGSIVQVIAKQPECSLTVTPSIVPFGGLVTVTLNTNDGVEDLAFINDRGVARQEGWRTTFPATRIGPQRVIARVKGVTGKDGICSEPFTVGGPQTARIDLKANGQDEPQPVPIDQPLTLSWSAPAQAQCNLETLSLERGSVSRTPVPPNGSETKLLAEPMRFIFRCTMNSLQGPLQAVDEVEVPVICTDLPQSITRNGMSLTARCPGHITVAFNGDAAVTLAREQRNYLIAACDENFYEDILEEVPVLQACLPPDDNNGATVCSLNPNNTLALRYDGDCEGAAMVKIPVKPGDQIRLFTKDNRRGRGSVRYFPGPAGPPVGPLGSF